MDTTNPICQALELHKREIAELTAQIAFLRDAHNLLTADYFRDRNRMIERLIALEQRFGTATPSAPSIGPAGASDRAIPAPGATILADSWQGPDGWVTQYTQAVDPEYIHSPGYEEES